jgi:hypothetical protein
MFEHLSFQNSSTLLQASKLLVQLNSGQASQLSEQPNSVASISAIRTAQLYCKHLSFQNSSALLQASQLSEHFKFVQASQLSETAYFRVNSRGIGTVSNFTTCRNGSPYSAYSSLFDSRPLFLSSLYSSLHPSLSLPDSRYVHLING